MINVRKFTKLNRILVFDLDKIEKYAQYVLKTFLQNRNHERYGEIEKQVKKKRFSIGDIGIEHHWITHWHKEGLLLENLEFRKWRKFNLIDYVWLKAIVKLRSFDIPLRFIKAVK